MSTAATGDTWRTVEPLCRMLPGQYKGRGQVCANVIVRGKPYFCSLVELAPYGLVKETIEFMAFPVKKNGCAYFSPVFERCYFRGEAGMDVDVPTWRMFVEEFYNSLKE